MMFACSGLQYYFETIFPRIPVVVERAVKEDLQKRGLPAKAVGNGGTGKLEEKRATV